MRRKLTWVDQAKRVFESELPPDFIDSNRPDLFSMKWTAIQAGAALQISPDAGDLIVRPRYPTSVRVYFIADKHNVVGFAITASYDGGRTFENPLLRYPPITQLDDQVLT
jgi:hypothetical protein